MRRWALGKASSIKWIMLLLTIAPLILSSFHVEAQQDTPTGQTARLTPWPWPRVGPITAQTVDDALSGRRMSVLTALHAAPGRPSWPAGDIAVQLIVAPDVYARQKACVHRLRDAMVFAGSIIDRQIHVGLHRWSSDRVAGRPAGTLSLEDTPGAGGSRQDYRYRIELYAGSGMWESGLRLADRDRRDPTHVSWRHIVKQMSRDERAAVCGESLCAGLGANDIPVGPDIYRILSKRFSKTSGQIVDTSLVYDLERAGSYWARLLRKADVVHDVCGLHPDILREFIGGLGPSSGVGLDLSRDPRHYPRSIETHILFWRLVVLLVANLPDPTSPVTATRYETIRQRVLAAAPRIAEFIDDWGR